MGQPCQDYGFNAFKEATAWLYDDSTSYTAQGLRFARLIRANKGMGGLLALGISELTLKHDGKEVTLWVNNEITAALDGETLHGSRSVQRHRLEGNPASVMAFLLGEQTRTYLTDTRTMEQRQPDSKNNVFLRIAAMNSVPQCGAGTHPAEYFQSVTNASDAARPDSFVLDYKMGSACLTPLLFLNFLDAHMQLSPDFSEIRIGWTSEDWLNQSCRMPCELGPRRYSTKIEGGIRTVSIRNKQNTTELSFPVALTLEDVKGLEGLLLDETEWLKIERRKPILNFLVKSERR